MFNSFSKRKKDKQIEKSVQDFNTLWNSNIEDIWTITDKNQFLVAMNGWICRKCNYGEDMGKLSEAEKIFFLNNQLEQEINNGGLSQFFFNSSGDFANEIEYSLRSIGAVHTEKIYSKALLALGGELPENRDEREEMLDNILTDNVSELLNECDNEFYKYLDNLEELNYQFIIKNKEQFI